MTTADILTECLQAHGGDAATLSDGADTLRIVAGRPGSVAFTLQREVASSVTLTLAEGFTLDGRVHYTQRTLPEVTIEGIIQTLAREATRVTPPPAVDPALLEIAVDD